MNTTACPEREERAALSDAEFWERVLQPDAALYPEEPEVDPGRPLIHATGDDL